MRAHITTAVLMLATIGQAGAQSANEIFLQRTFTLGGMLLRAAKACDRNTEDFTYWSTCLQTLDAEVAAFGKAFPDLTTKWMIGGAEVMNRMIVNEGMNSACQVAFDQMKIAAAAIMENNEKQRQRR